MGICASLLKCAMCVCVCCLRTTASAGVLDAARVRGAQRKWKMCRSDCFLKRVGVDKQPPHCEVLPRRFSHMVVLVDCWQLAIGSLSVGHNHTHTQANTHTLAAFFQSQTISFSLPPASTYHILCSLAATLLPLHNVRWGDVLWQIK